MKTFDTALLLLQLLAILVTSRVFAAILSRLRQPLVIAEMLAGLALGPSVLGWAAPAVAGRLFAVESLAPLEALSQIGLIIATFMVGWNIDLALLRRKRRLALLTSGVSVAVPFALGCAVAATILRHHAPPTVAQSSFVLFIGAAMSITAFPVLIRILIAHEMLQTPIGTVAVACAAFDDVVGWLIVAFVTGTVVTDRAVDVNPLLALLGYGVLMGIVSRRLVGTWCVRPGRDGSLASVRLFPTVVTALASALVTHLLGLHTLFGAFCAGLIMPRLRGAEGSASAQLQPITATLLLPCFFALTGLRTDLSSLAESSALWETLLILLVAIVGKLGGAMVTLRGLGRPWAESACIGVLLNTRGLVELVILNIGFDLGILSSELYSMLALMTLITTCMTSPVLTLLRRRVCPEPALQFAVARQPTASLR